MCAVVLGTHEGHWNLRIEMPMCSQFLEAKPRGHFYFTYWFVEAWRRLGGCVKADSSLPHLLRVGCGRYLGFNCMRLKGKLVVCGWHRIESATWPWNYFWEVVPMMWDLWPCNYKYFVRYLKLNRVRLAFITSTVNVARLRQDLPNVRFVWIPEAVEISAYPRGPILKNRRIDVLSYGRQNEKLHEILAEAAGRGDIKYQRGAGFELESLIRDLHSSRITITYPRSYTNPEIAGNVETLTIRYWEAMLTGVVMVGKAPKELVDVCGYDPVVPMDEANCMSVIMHILKNIGQYQGMVERNRKTAELYGGWEDRLRVIESNLAGDRVEYVNLEVNS